MIRTRSCFPLIYHILLWDNVKVLCIGIMPWSLSHANSAPVAWYHLFLQHIITLSCYNVSENLILLMFLFWDNNNNIIPALLPWLLFLHHSEFYYSRLLAANECTVIVCSNCVHQLFAATYKVCKLYSAKSADCIYLQGLVRTLLLFASFIYNSILVKSVADI